VNDPFRLILDIYMRYSLEIYFRAFSREISERKFIDSAIASSAI